MKKTIFILLLVTLLPGCGIQYPSQPTPTQSNGPWLDAFLLNPTCQPPCWENITPGVTTIDEAYELIKKNPYAANVTLETHPTYRDGEIVPRVLSYTISWDFIGTTDAGRISSDPMGKTVSQIYIPLGESKSLTLGEVVQSYGPPDDIVISLNTHNLRYCVIDFYYKQLGTVIDTPIDIPCRDRKHVQIGENITIWSVTMGSIIGDALVADWAAKSLIKWAGYGEYERK